MQSRQIKYGDLDKSRGSGLPPFSPVSKIQNGDSEKAPVFCFPGAGANSTCFLPLANALGVEYSVLGVDQRGLDGNRIPFESIEEAAECYAEHIISTNPGSSVHFVTHSFGSWLGFQTALLLKEKGIDVSSLVILDGRSPSKYGILRRRCDRLYCFDHLVKLFAQASGRKINFDAADIEGLDDLAQLEVLASIMKSSRLIPSTTRLDSIKAMMDVFIANLNMPYEPSGTFEGRVLLVRAADPDDDRGSHDDAEESKNEHELAWRRYAPNLTRFDVVGNHMSMLQESRLGLVVNYINEFTPEPA